MPGPLQLVRRQQVVVLGGGQCGRAADHHLRGIDFTALDAQATPCDTRQHVRDPLGHRAGQDRPARDAISLPRREW
ncbi:hypothetical protein [Streptomyces wuyuanensis]|uniref:hypothetical protein n=1 Tax=Streptomyces wuyuanensis TaxID=1196353 RepID=UPI0037A7EEBB